MCLCYILRLYINTYVVRNVVSTRTSSNYNTQQKKKIIDYKMPATIVHQREREPEPAAENKHQYKRTRMRPQHTTHYYYTVGTHHTIHHKT